MVVEASLLIVMNWLGLLHVSRVMMRKLEMVEDESDAEFTDLIECLDKISLIECIYTSNRT